MLKIFLILFLIIFASINIFANSLCVKCHKSHYLKLGECTTCHRGISKTTRKKIAHFNLIKGKFADFLFNFKDREKGEDAVKVAHCRRCHFIDNTGNFIAKNLSISGMEKNGEYLFLKIKKPDNFMPDFNMDNLTIIYIAKYLLYIGSKGEKSKNKAYPLFFTNKSKNLFEKNCGNCHKIISKNSGPLGKFSKGPNLSGIFTKFYPLRKGINKWDKNTLIKWISNPRKFDKFAIMPPVVINHKDLNSLLMEIE